MSLRQVTLGSLAMSSVGILRLMTQLLVLPVLARYLTPEDYGIVAIAMPFVLFAMSFSDAGMSQSLIRTSSQDRTEWSTSFWFTVLLGLALSGVITAFGFGLSVFMNEPLLFPILACLSSIIFLQSLATVPGASLQQNHKFPTIAGIEIAAMFISLMTTLWAALNGFGAWSLVFQQLSHYIVKLFLTLFFSRFAPVLSFKIHSIREHLIFGRDVLGSDLISFIRDSLQRVIMGKVLGTSAVGIFSMSKLFSDVPRRIVAGPLQMVLYPRFSMMRDNNDDMQHVLVFISRVIAMIVIPTVGMIGIAHDPVFTILLSEKWAEAGYIFMLISPAAALAPVASLLNTVCLSKGKTDILVRLSVEVCILFLISLGICVWYGLDAVAIGLMIAHIVYLFRMVMLILPIIDMPTKRYLSLYITPVFSTSLSVIAYYAVDQNFDFNDWKLFGMAIGLGIMAVIFIFLIQYKMLLKDFSVVRHKLLHNT